MGPSSSFYPTAGVTTTTTSSSGHLLPTPPGRGKQSDIDEMVTIAAQQTTAAMSRDTRLPDLWHLFAGSTLSRDYSVNGDAEQDFVVKRLTVIPESLLQFAEEQADKPVLMGLLPEIGRAWMAFGHRLFLFDCTSSCTDLLCFEEGNGDPILNVGYCASSPPSPSSPPIFVESVKGVLVVVTPSAVQLLAVSAQDSADTTLHPTDFCCSTDGVNMLSMHVFQDRRIFLGGADGCLYEVQYGVVAASSSLFSLAPSRTKRQCRLKNWSESFLTTALLPNLLRRSSTPDPIIHVSSDHKEQLYVLHESNRIDIYCTATVGKVCTIGNVAEQVERMCPGFVSAGFKLISVHPLHSPYLSFVAVSGAGTRIYFSSLTRDQLGYDPVQLQHLREGGGGGGWEKSGGEGMRVVHVRLLIPPSQHHATDDPRRLVHRTIQPAVHVALSGSACCLVAVSAEQDLSDQLVCCLVDPAAVLSGGESGMLRRPIERSSSLKLDGRVWEIKALHDLFTASELIIHPACSETYLVLTNAGVYELERRPLIDADLGKSVQDLGLEQCTALVMTACIYNPQRQALLAMVKSNEDVSPNQHQPPPAAFLSTDSGSGRTMTSGLFLCFARLCRSFWQTDCAAISIADLAIFRRLKTFHMLLTANAALFGKSDAFFGLIELVSRCSELLTFVLLCQDYQVFQEHRPDTATALRATFDSIFTDSSPEFVKQAADALVAKQLASNQQNALDNVVQVLAQRCPSFFGHSQMLLYSGMEWLERAKRCKEIGCGQVEYKECMSATIDSLVKSADCLTFSSYSRFMQQLFEMLQADGDECRMLIDLTVAFAAACDPHNLAIIAYQQPSALTHDAVLVREQCYGLLLDYLGRMTHSSAPSTPAILLAFLSHSAQCADELMQIRLFEYLISAGMSGLMLEQMRQSAYLEPFLLLRFNSSSERDEDLLWRFYGLNSRFKEAAQVLLQMAECSSDLGIAERVERLSRAVAFVQSAADVPLRTDCQDLLDVASVQLELHVRLCVPELGTRLLSLSDLFNSFSRKHRCAEQSLRLLELSLQAGGAFTKDIEHVVGQVWQEAIDDAIDDEAVLLEQMRRLLHRFYHQTNTVVPVAMLLDHLSQRAVLHGSLSPGSIVQMLCNILPVSVLVDAVDQLQTRSSFWAQQRPFLCHLIVEVAKQCRLGDADKRLLLNRLDGCQKTAGDAGLASEIAATKNRLK